MAIAYYAEDIQLPAIKKKAVSGWIKAVAETYGKKTGDISYIFCSDEKILEVNRQYLQHDYYTDIITFDYTEGNKISGDLFISLDTVRTNAETFHVQFDRVWGGMVGRDSLVLNVVADGREQTTLMRCQGSGC